jgi:hypothetical protein
MKRTTLVLLAAILLAFFPSLAQASAVGKFTHVEGRVDVIPPGQPARAAALGDEVSIGDTLRTKSQSKAEVTFNDGNVLRLAERTAMVISEYMVDQESTSGTLKLSRGKIQNIVKVTGGRIFGRDKKDRFEVHTPTAIVGVRGTDFFTYHTRGISGALFQEGKGYGFSANRPEEVKDISAGQAMVVVSADQVPVIKPATDVEIKLHINDTAPSKKDETKDTGKTGETPSGLGTDKDAALASAATGDTGSTTAPKTQKTTPPSSTQPTSPGQSQTNPTVVPPPVTLPSPTQQPTTSLVDVSSSVNLVFGSGSLSGSLDPATNQGTVSISGTLSGDPELSHTTSLSGTMGDGTTFIGDLSGAIGSWHVGFRSIYAKGGSVGYFYGNPTGSMNTGAGTFSASGTAYRSPAYGSISGALTLTPELFDSDRLPIISGLHMGTDGIQSDAHSSGNRGIETSSGRLLGIWNARTTSGTFQNPGGLSFNTFVYGKHELNYEESDYFILGNVSASDDLGSEIGHVAIGGNNLRFMDTQYMGDLSLWYHGCYNPDPESRAYYSAGAGTYTLDHLALTGYWSSASLHYNNLGNFASAEDLFGGLIGGLTAPWNSSTSPFSAMGSYALSEAAPAGTYLWNAGITGWSPGNTGFKSDDEGNDTGFTGFTAGFWKEPTTTFGTVDGAASAIYMTSGGGAGLLTSSNLSGSHFPGLGMWMVDGTLVRTPKTTVSDPSYYKIYDGDITGLLSGTFGATSTILGEIDSGITRFFKDMHEGSPTYHTSLSWGIYNLKFGLDNEYTGKPVGLANWSSIAGGQGLFGYYLGAGDSGYWLAGITGTWSDAGELRASLSGTYLTPIRTGTLAGPFTGISSAASGTWIGQSIGTFEGQALLFNGETSNGKLLRFDGVDFQGGTVSGLLGSLDDLWPATLTAPASIRLMGDYSEGWAFFF